jgi:hypothetical protein
MPKETAAAIMQGTRKSGQSKGRRGEFERDLNIMEVKNEQEMARDHLEWRKIVLEAKVHNRLQSLRRKKGRRSRRRRNEKIHIWSSQCCI